MSDEPKLDKAARLERLVDRVTARTKGTAGDPLTRPEVEQVVKATLNELGVEHQDTPAPDVPEAERPGADPEPADPDAGGADEDESEHPPRPSQLPATPGDDPASSSSS